MSFVFIGQKLIAANESIQLDSLLNGRGLIYFISVCLLIGVNWGLEAFKWKVLISSLEIITYLKALQSVFAGVTISIFSPNRVGEFAGRIFFLEHADKVQASLRSFTGSMIQLAITLFAGLVALFAYFQTDLAETHSFVFLNNSGVKIWLLFLVLFLIFLLLANRLKKSFSEKAQGWLKGIFGLDRRSFMLSFFLSLCRYAVYSLQYYLVLLLFNVDVDPSTGFMLIALSFMVTSLIPTFALTEIAVRGATAVYFFSGTGAAPGSVIAASLLLWLLNLGLPALAGSFFIWKLKFFR
ncbi:MAG: flippase-like domain-containing protein [Bacteroidota bacterium]|nr:flippase-like domain-containing protein [Bacteroidota bacterium]